MTLSPTDRTKLNDLVPNLDIGDVADPLLRLQVFQEIYMYLDSIIADGNAAQAAGAITTAKLADGSVMTVKLADNAVTGPKILDGSIVTLKLADGAVTSVKLGSGSVTSEKIADLAVGQAHHQDNGIPSRALPDNVILQRHMSDNSVGSAEIQAGAVQRTHLGSGVVGSGQLDPALLENYGDIAVQAKFEEVDAQLAENASRGELKFFNLLQQGTITKIKLIGDSITFGTASTGVSEDPTGRAIGTTGHKEANFTAPSWANYFRKYITAKYPTIDFFNAGIGGWSSKVEGVTYKDTWIGTSNDFVFVMLGANDRSDCTSEQDFFNAIEAFCLAVKATCNNMIVMTSPPTLNDYYSDGTKNSSLNLTMEQIDKVITAMCIKNNFTHISFYREFLRFNLTSGTGFNSLLESSNDPAVLPGSHPIDDGHLLMWKILQQRLGIVKNTWAWESEKLKSTESAKSRMTQLDATNYKLNNLVRNGDFSRGTDSWTGSGGGTLTAGTGEGIVTGKGNNATVEVYTVNFESIVGSNKKIYVCAEIKPDFEHITTRLRMDVSGVSGTLTEINTGHKTVGTYSRMSNVYTTSAGYDTDVPRIYAQVQYADAATANLKTYKIRNAVAFNLTDIFGAGNEPSKEEMDTLMDMYGGYIKSGTTKNMITDLYNNYKPKMDAMWANATKIIKNMLANGNFVDTANWTAAACTNTASNNTLTSTGLGTSATCITTQHTAKITGNANKIYYTVKLRPNSNPFLSLRMVARNAGADVADSTISAFYETLTLNDWTRKSGILTTNDKYVIPNTFSVFVQHVYVDATTANGKTVDLKDFVVLNLTEIFGAGNEPTAEIMDSIVNEINKGFIAA